MNHPQTLTRLGRVFTSAAALAALAACGGGGSDSSNSSPAPAPAPVSTPSPAPAPSAPAPAPAAVSISPTPLVFPTTTFGTTTAPQTVTLTNSGGSSFQVKSYTNDPQFRVASGTCLTASVVAPGASCTLDVTFMPTERGAITGSLALNTEVLGPLALAMAGASPTTTSLVLRTKLYTLTYPAPIGGLSDTDPATLPSDVTASLWNVAASTSAFGSGPGSPIVLTGSQPLSSIPWPIRLGYWSLSNGSTTTRGTGCQIDLVGSSLVFTVNGTTTTVQLDGTPPALNNQGQAIFAGDVMTYGANQRTVGTVSVVRFVQIDAFDGALLGDASVIHLYAGYDSHGSGAYGTAYVIRQTATTLQQYMCSDTP